MKKSEYNRDVISNFILFYTHQNEDEAMGEARRMYDLLDSYIEEDHADGIEGDEDSIISFIHYEVFEVDKGQGTKTIDSGSDLKKLIKEYHDRIEKGELSIDRWQDGKNTYVDFQELGL